MDPEGKIEAWLFDAKQSSVLRLRTSWVLLIVVPYAASVIWLGWAVILVPLVLMMAPAGLFAVFKVNIEKDFHALWCVHVTFWTVFLSTFIYAKRINLAVLRVVFTTLATAIALTCYGCFDSCLDMFPAHTDPLRGWSRREFAAATVPEAIKQDALAYFRTLPEVERNAMYDDSNLEYYEDGTGQRAVVLKASHDMEHWQIAVIYDQGNRRVKVLKYSVGGYMS